MGQEKKVVFKIVEHHLLEVNNFLLLLFLLNLYSFLKIVLSSLQSEVTFFNCGGLIKKTGDSWRYRKILWRYLSFKQVAVAEELKCMNELIPSFAVFTPISPALMLMLQQGFLQASIDYLFLCQELVGL